MPPPWLDSPTDRAQNPVKRQRNLEEAVRALETVLLLDHQNHEAKFYLAACYRDRAMYRVDTARGYLREVAESPPEDSWCDSARAALARSYQWDKSSTEAQRWFEEAARRAKDPLTAEFYRAQARENRGRAIASDASSSGSAPADQASREFFEGSVLGAIQGQENVLRGQSGGTDDSAGLSGLVEAYSRDKVKLAFGYLKLAQWADALRVFKAQWVGCFPGWPWVSGDIRPEAKKSA